LKIVGTKKAPRFGDACAIECVSSTTSSHIHGVNNRFTREQRGELRKLITALVSVLICVLLCHVFHCLMLQIYNRFLKLATKN
jgi:hypothetical protein